MLHTLRTSRSTTGRTSHKPVENFHDGEGESARNHRVGGQKATRATKVDPPIGIHVVVEHDADQVHECAEHSTRREERTNPELEPHPRPPRSNALIRGSRADLTPPIQDPAQGEGGHSRQDPLGIREVTDPSQASANALGIREAGSFRHLGEREDAGDDRGGLSNSERRQYHPGHAVTEGQRRETTESV